MKTLLAIAIGTVLLGSCNSAQDGKAETDTTNLLVDTNRFTAPTDTLDHINSNTGTISTDSSQPSKAEVNSSKPTPPKSRRTTPHDPARIDTMRQ
jgi:hypothetical protein